MLHFHPALAPPLYKRGIMLDMRMGVLDFLYNTELAPITAAALRPGELVAAFMSR